MDPLIIIATPNNSWLHPQADYPSTVEAIAKEATQCAQNGASILHTHAEGKWVETIQAVRAYSNIVVQCGMSSLPISDRMDVWHEHADMISIILNHHDEAFAQTECNVLHFKDELAEYAALSRQYGVVLEYEVWHTGSIWNLNWMIQKQLIEPPYVCTLFFGWPGGTWSPPTIEEYLYRRKQMPLGSICNVSIMEEHQIDIVTTAILNGDHVRVGTEDYPYNRAGKIVPTHELVRETAEIARAIGRPVATPEQARQMIGLRRQAYV